MRLTAKQEEKLAYLGTSRNRVDKNAGGILTSIILKDTAESMKVDKGHSKSKVPVNFLNVHGQQECRMRREEIDDHLEEIRKKLFIVLKKERKICCG